MIDHVNLIRKILSHEAGPFVQFLKYATVGVMATCVQTAVFYALAATLIPCLGAEDVAVRYLGLPAAELTDSVRAVRAAIAVGCGFMVANLFCWLMNRWFVFKPGRHVWYVEFLLFFTVSLVAFGVGVGLQTLLIHAAGVMTTVAFLAEVFSSLVINFVVRKFFVFKG